MEYNFKLTLKLEKNSWNNRDMKLQGHHNNNTKGASGHHFFPWLNVTRDEVTVQDFQKPKLKKCCFRTWEAGVNFDNL
jgi:hypothetical protein